VFRKLRCRKRTDPVLIQFLFKNKYPNPILIRKNSKYPAGYPDPVHAHLW